MTFKKFKKGDKIIITAGKDRGKKSEIVQVLPNQGKVIAKGINIYKKHIKPTQDKAGGILEIERPIDPGKFMLLDESGKPTRAGFKITGKSKTRISKTTGNKL